MKRRQSVLRGCLIWKHLPSTAASRFYGECFPLVLDSDWSIWITVRGTSQPGVNQNEKGSKRATKHLSQPLLWAAGSVAQGFIQITVSPKYTQARTQPGQEPNGPLGETEFDFHFFKSFKTLKLNVIFPPNQWFANCILQRFRKFFWAFKCGFCFKFIPVHSHHWAFAGRKLI